MSQININIRMEENLKRDFEAVCGEMGLTMTSAFTIFAKAVSARREIPFRVTAERPVRDTAFASENALASVWLPPDEDEEWGHLPGARLNAGESAGKWHEWADPALMDADCGSAWAEAAVKNEIRKREDMKKDGIAGY